MRTRLMIAALVLCSSAACAGRGRSPAAQREPPTAARVAPVVLQHAAAYETRTEAEPARGAAVDGQLRESLARAAERAGLALDGRLAELALGIAAASDGARHPPSYLLVSYHAHRAGIAEPTPQVWLAVGASSAALIPAFEQAIAGAARSTKLTHCGMAALYADTAEPERGVVIALALSSRVLSLKQAVPRSVPVGGIVRLEGELAAGHSAPVLAVTTEAGVTRSALAKSRRFQRDVALTQAGETTLELLATGPLGLEVVALMPIMVGAPAPRDPPSLEAVPIEADAQEVTHKLLTLIADERARRALPPLQIDARLSGIALAHSQDMFQHAFIAHSSRRSGDATARVTARGLEPLLVLENIGRGYSATELHRGLMASPGHRANILHPDARELGIGVVAEREGDRNAFIVTELFTQLREAVR